MTLKFDNRSVECTYEDSHRLKRNHSLQVSALAGLISKKLCLGKEDIILAKVIGLLHDVGRFEQYMRYRTFVDRHSFDHGKFGANFLMRLKPIIDLNFSDQKIIQCAVTRHNKARIYPGINGRQLLHTQIIRDADKLDILHITTRDIHSPDLN